MSAPACQAQAPCSAAGAGTSRTCVARSGGLAQVLRNAAHDMGESGLYDSWSQAQPASPREAAPAEQAERAERAILESHASRVLSPIAEADACVEDLELRTAASAPADLQVGPVPVHGWLRTEAAAGR